MVVKLETAEGEFVANTKPLLPLEPTKVVFWGTRVFLHHYGDVWRETTPTVVRNSDGREA